MAFKDKSSDDGPEMDEIDTAFVNSLLPEGCMATGLIAVVTWIDGEDGTQRWRVYNQLTSSLSADLGMLELAKLELICRTDCGLPMRYPHLDGDDD